MPKKQEIRNLQKGSWFEIVMVDHVTISFFILTN